MTTDMIQDEHLQWKAKIVDASKFQNRTRKKRIELTRMENFLDGQQDIFDVLQNHAANRQMKIKQRVLADEITPENLSETPLFRTLWTKLKHQMSTLTQ